jgi:Dyp-type peroxidase family
MTDTLLDLHDIQGNIVKAYGRYGFPKGRFIFFGVLDATLGRRFVSALAPTITNSAPWRERGTKSGSAPIPECTTNIAFTYHGLRDLGVPRASLQSFPDEFAMGMRARRDILGDEGASAPERWDPIWRQEEHVHVMVALNGRDEDCLERRYQQVLELMRSCQGGVTLLAGHRGPGGREDLEYQAASALFDEKGVPTPKEHFGYTDGIGDAFFKGTGAHESNVIGGGKLTGLPPSLRVGWAPLETGEFLLGYKDEARECPEAPSPKLLSHNGTFMVYRKLHQNVGSFDAYLEHVGAEYPGGKEALAAKFAGRWRNGAPVVKFPSEAEANAFADRWLRAKTAIAKASNNAERDAAKREFAGLNQQFAAFDYTQDVEGGRCPLGAHIRRTNPRTALEYGKTLAFEAPSALSNRRRLLRRGLPYGDSTKRTDEGDHGILFMALNASLRRQFEFVQQQWLNYGNDFRLANERDALTGNHPPAGGSAVLQSDPKDPAPPFFCSKLPRFVETRGGDYFFVPSLTALRMIGEGSLDPT